MAQGTSRAEKLKGGGPHGSPPSAAAVALRGAMMAVLIALPFCLHAVASTQQAGSRGRGIGSVVKPVWKSIEKVRKGMKQVSKSINQVSKTYQTIIEISKNIKTVSKNIKKGI